MYLKYAITFLVCYHFSGIKCKQISIIDIENVSNDENDNGRQESDGSSGQWLSQLVSKYHGHSEDTRRIREFPDNCNPHEVIAFCGNHCWVKLLKSQWYREVFNCEICVKKCFHSILGEDCEGKIMGRLSATMDKMNQLNRLSQFSGTRKSKKGSNKKGHKKKLKQRSLNEDS